MPRVMITCPQTGKHVYTGLNFDWMTFESIGPEQADARCPLCGETHEWSKDEAFLIADGGEC